MTSRADRGGAGTFPLVFSVRRGGERFAFVRDVPVSLVVGRSLALICHPQLAWQRLPPAGRAALAFGYGAVSYLSALLALFVLRG